jgi:signal transduction histidine kinase/CheY-like chemotaxis protein
MSPSSVSLGSGAPRAHINRAGIVSGWDPAFETLWGRAAGQAVGRKLQQLLVPLEPAALPDFDSVDGAEGWSGIVALVPDNGNAPRTSGIRLTRASAGAGGGDLLELRLAPLSVLAGEAPNGDAPLEAGRDLQRFAALLELVPGYCYTVDRNLAFTSSAGKGLAALNLRPGQVIGVNLRDLWGTQEDTYEPLVCHLKALAGISTNYSDVCLGRSIELLIRPLRDAEGVVVGAIGVAIDVTEREQARDEQRKLTAQLRQAQKMEAIGRLAGGLAHDFNNYLTCILGNLSLLEAHAPRGSDAESFLLQASSAVDSAASLTRQLLAFSRAQVVHPRPVNLSVLVERSSKLWMRLLGDNITLRTDCAGDLWSVNADAGQLEQALVNLVMNARDAIAGAGEVVVATRNCELLPGSDLLQGSDLLPGKYVELSVQDTGRGLSDLERQRLFEPFFTTKDVGEGTGLGLSTVNATVQQNRGAIRVESAQGKGTTFHILLPQVDAVAAYELPYGARGRALSAAPGGTETILLVEDEPLVLEMAQRTLQQLGYNVLPCSSADEALRTFGEYQSKVQLLVTDLMMPRMNGKELASRISALSPGVPVLFSSGYGESMVAQQGVVDDGVHYIGKPYRPRELADRVRNLLDQRSALQ